MRVFTKRNALIGWLLARVARKRLERRLNELAGHRRRRPWLAIVSGVLAAGLAAGAIVVRRSQTAG